ncbi:hypothetical protein TI39_contig613g00028 [Zymoseptoria brevis]|uniref:DUF7730 domain-containing protein n=1 Tax=Zymoseptoria brevis TaxID=1047168 RepID=A0A0F4GH35_9PEZI|nr:hypothetical protein TI39_contig613g00028 [Zymoseptoria brevis]
MEATSNSAAARTPIDGGADLNSTSTTTKNTTSATDGGSIETKQQLSKDITAIIKKSNLRNNYPTAVASKAISTSDQSQSSLMALPPEIRNNIWENTLKVHAWNKYGVHIVFADFPKEKNKKMAPFHQPTDPQRRPNSVLSLLRTCCAINTEALPLFYTLNHLWIRGHYVSSSLPTTTSRGGMQPGIFCGIGHARVGLSPDQQSTSITRQTSGILQSIRRH